MRKNNFRNIAIIAHVDHGKTTLVDGLLKQSGTFHERQEVEDRVMDSMDLEKERGITITAKNTAVQYNDIKINIIDTPGHADFGGEVERSLNLVDGALLLVDSSEGPLPQTRFVLKKALDKQLPIILVINKIDRGDARIDEVVNEVYDLFIDLDADDDQIEFPIIYTNAKDGIGHLEMGDSSTNLEPLFDTILDKIPGPAVDDDHTPQFLITNLEYDPYVGQIAVGRLNNGRLEMNKQYSLCGENGIKNGEKFSALYTFKGLQKIPVDTLEAGDIIAVAGIEGIAIGDTISSNENPVPMPRIQIDKPTVSMLFYVNNGPFAGQEGKYLTSRHLGDRLQKETLGNVSLEIILTDRPDIFEVCGRGELQMAVLIETMRREGYEFMVSKPRVITHEENGKMMEPMEDVFLDIPEDKVGTITEKLSIRKGRMTNLQNHGHGRVNMEFKIPSRGLIGFRSQFLTDTQGAGIMNKLFAGFAPWFGAIPQRKNGALVSDRKGKTTTYASLGMVDRGELFIPVTTEVYPGMIIGERNRSGDLDVNITREKKLTNMRSANSDMTVTLRPHRILSLDQSLEFIAEDELVEVTPENIRLRKMELDAGKRAAAKKKEKYANEALNS
ncbi:MAG: translational GTPase TypA [Candidatus Marinimicrobia bacterium]|jgi:GTP-binding protein|nr:translational GTPase TypA [Candidatus Neomarinimicrobiota bacterium]MBT3937797.1 translational GTPase TypA [Candidatus Neomarinimicrobiota bacterium]MBT3962247.1 translational GTPase TypA [Candidatus Neomarinimicrobiota bacterium]MBT4382222.1 translational GTPase TypA [Candidatus Neomarinimicrobiota bacterium]MBT4635839.1 translational GTPase TypA [Candidatus Neomarinimicrobiota bacterium]